MTSLQAQVRTEMGKGVARKLRASGRCPAVVYGPDSEPLSITIDPEALIEIFDETRNANTIVTIELDGKTVDCLVRDVQRHPLDRDVLHVDFYQVDANRTVVVDVPLVPVGRPVGAVLGGRLRLIRRTLAARCLPKDIPATFEIDASPLHIGDMVRASEIPLPEGVTLELDNDINVLTCYGKKRGGQAAAAAEG